MDLDMARRDEIPQQFTSEQVTTIKNAVKGRRGNVNITPYHIYDNDEHKVGEWRETIDGVKKCKPVYERTITGVSPSSTAWINTNLSNVEKVSNINGILAESNTQYTSIPTGHPVATTYECYLSFDTTTNKIYFGGGSKYLNRKYIITIQYTKTTDSWEVVVE